MGLGFGFRFGFQSWVGVLDLVLGVGFWIWVWVSDLGFGFRFGFGFGFGLWIGLDWIGLYVSAYSMSTLPGFASPSYVMYGHACAHQKLSGRASSGLVIHELVLTYLPAT